MKCFCTMTQIIKGECRCGSPLLCDDCNVRPEWKGEHRCHTANGQREMIVRGVRVYEFCECPKCKPPTPEELKAFRENFPNE